MASRGVFENFECQCQGVRNCCLISWISPSCFLKDAEQGASDSACPVRPDRIGGDSFQPFGYHADYLQVRMPGGHGWWRPRRGSNAQPLDSKSITLSIELRGRTTRIILERQIVSLETFGNSMIEQGGTWFWRFRAGITIINPPWGGSGDGRWDDIRSNHRIHMGRRGR
jgi:hypothetical protein